MEESKTTNAANQSWPVGAAIRHRCVVAACVVLTLALLLVLLKEVVIAQSARFPTSLPANRFRSGEETLRAFRPISTETRFSIVKFNVDGETVALGTVVDTNGLVLTKASEIKKGKLTCWLANEQEVDAELLETDPDEDIAFVQLRASGLKPIVWAEERVDIGQWAITPGVAETPHAVGIISALPRRIRPPRAFIGIRFDLSTPAPKIEELLPGLGAEKAGLKMGDVIVALNDAAVSNREQVVEIVSDFREGQTIKVGVERADKRFDAEIALMVPKAGGKSSGQSRTSRLNGEVSQRAGGFEQAIEHDTVLPPWLCGGPLVNLEGKAIGINIARAGRVTTYALSASILQRIIQAFEERRNEEKLILPTGTDPHSQRG
jgi:serine protease Do